jgi:hypothetical protein
MDALFKVPHMDPGNLLLRCPRCRSYGMAQLLGVTTRPDPTVAVGGADTIGDRIGYLGREPQFRYERWECSARHRFQIVINLARAPRSGP